MNDTILLFAVRHAIGRDTLAMASVSKFIMENIHDISVGGLEDILHELTAYYKDHTEDSNYLTVTKLCVAIKRELYG